MNKVDIVIKHIGNDDFYDMNGTPLLTKILAAMDEYAQEQVKNCSTPDVVASSIRIPKPCLKFEGLDNLSIVSENPIPLSDLFELHLKLENYLKTRPETIVNNDGLIVGFKNYR